MTAKRGILYLVPNLLDPDSSPESSLPAAAIAQVRAIRHFVVEGEKAAWRLLSPVLSAEEASRVSMERLDEHTPPEALPALLSPLRAGEDIGLISEAGMPCVADPGAALVALAHDSGFEVVPLIGPSSILLALAASGLDGQRFSFLGYLPQDRGGRRLALSAIDRGLREDGATRIFIETPYRNAVLLEDCIASLSPVTVLCVAASLCSSAARIVSKTVADWRAETWRPGKEPAIFLVGRRAGMGPASAGAVRPPKRGLARRGNSRLDRSTLRRHS
jgi:16S rRNA (cytidine1402-2'-O)-methyltransferase